MATVLQAAASTNREVDAHISHFVQILHRFDVLDASFLPVSGSIQGQTKVGFTDELFSHVYNVLVVFATLYPLLSKACTRTNTREVGLWIEEVSVCVSV